MKLKSILILFATLLMIVSCFGLTASAEEDANSTMSEPVFTVPTYSVHIKYTSDSSASKGISHETYVDPATLKVSFKITEDLSVGHVIYDDPSTPYIDGIRVNGNTVDTLNIDVTDGTEYIVDVRTVYEDNLLGDFAKIIDGKFNLRTVLENPVTLFMAVYYLLAILSILVSTFASCIFRNKKVKTADEIAAKVEESAQEAVEKVRTEVLDAVLTEVQPILQTIVDDIKNVVTAITLSTSKSKDAPIAMLDTLQRSAETSNLNTLIDDIRKNVTESITKTSEVKSANLETLRAMTSSSSPAEATAVESVSDSTSTFKSVF